MTSGQLPQPIQPEEPESRELLVPTYQNRLRIIGRAMDEHHLERALIVDFDETLTLRAYSSKEERYISEIFTDEKLIETLRIAIYARGESGTGPFRSPLRPTGYEDFFRALGYQLDQRGASAVVILECPQYFHVSGEERIGDISNLTVAPFADMYEVPTINTMVNEAVARRTESQPGDAPLVRLVDPVPPVRILRTGARLP